LGLISSGVKFNPAEVTCASKDGAVANMT